VGTGVLALGGLRNWRGQVAFRKGRLINSPVFDEINVIPLRPRADIDRLKADSPDAAKKGEHTHSDQEEMRGGQ
jgi:hypothetical protein